MKPIVRLETPCPVSWNSMSPAEGGRHCASCDKVVRDVSALTKNEAEELILGNDGSLCINGLFDRARGEFVFAPEKKRLPVASPFAVAAAVTLAACSTRTGGEPPVTPTHDTAPTTQTASPPTDTSAANGNAPAEDPGPERWGGEAPAFPNEHPTTTEQPPPPAEEPPHRLGGRVAIEENPAPPQPPQPELERTGGVPPMPRETD